MSRAMVFRHPHPQRAAAAPRVGMVGVDSLDLSAHLFWPNLIRSRSMMGSTTLENKNAGRLKMMVVGRSNGPLLEKPEKGRTLYFVLGSTTPSYTFPAEKWPTRRVLKTREPNPELRTLLGSMRQEPPPTTLIRTTLAEVTTKECGISPA